MRSSHLTLFSALIVLKAVSSKARIGSFYLLSPSSRPCRNEIFFSLLRNQMLILSPSVGRKIVGVIGFAKRRDIVPLVST